MCNLSQGIKEAGIAEGREAGIAEGQQREIEKVILNMHKKRVLVRTDYGCNGIGRN